MHNSPAVFVLEISETFHLAFQANTATQAVSIAHAPWFIDAVTSFLRRAGRASVDINARRIRAASADEANTYDELCNEFERPASQVLVVNLSGFPRGTPAKSHC